MKWFVAKIVFRIVTSENTLGQFDEQLRMIEAFDEDEAFKKATLLGKQGEELIKGSKVYWRFIGISQLQNLGDLRDGLLIHANTTETDYAEGYTSYIQNREAELHSKHLYYTQAVA